VALSGVLLLISRGVDLDATVGRERWESAADAPGEAV
jgi:hypothetical protein